jgi:CRISPR-associated protein Csd1
MMISALASYYDQLLREHPDEVARIGWQPCKVKHTLVLSETGDVLRLIPSAEKKGTVRTVPMHIGGRNGVNPYLLCDTSDYIFGITSKELKARDPAAFLRKRFDESREKHRRVLGGAESPVAKAILDYFDKWNPDDVEATRLLGGEFSEACDGGFLTFAVLLQGGVLSYAIEDYDVIAACNAYEEPNENVPMICLATGAKTIPASLHPKIDGVAGTDKKPNLVSFNARAFESYGHEQGRNAPVGERAAQAYGLALNYLLSEPSHHLRIGDTTVVFWSERADQENADLFSMLLGGMPSGGSKGDSADVDRDLAATLSALRSGKRADLGGVDLDATFYVLGLAPNNARLSVRYFLKGGFGDMLENVERHYRRIEVDNGSSGRLALTPYWLLRAVENQEASNPVVTSELAAPLMRAILGGGLYPEALYSNALLRIKASREVSYAQAAIIKGYLIRNRGRSEDEVTVGLNENRCDVAYNLGRAFSYLGQIQEAANGKDTLTGRYLDSACARPTVVFPTLLKLTNDHLRKLSKEKPGLAINLEKGLTEVLDGDRVEAFPKQLSLPEQGDFLLGYYHQKAARYQKKTGKMDDQFINEPEEE